MQSIYKFNLEGEWDLNCFSPSEIQRPDPILLVYMQLLWASAAFVISTDHLAPFPPPPPQNKQTKTKKQTTQDSLHFN